MNNARCANDCTLGTLLQFPWPKLFPAHNTMYNSAVVRQKAKCNMYAPMGVKRSYEDDTFGS